MKIKISILCVICQLFLTSAIAQNNVKEGGLRTILKLGFSHSELSLRGYVFTPQLAMTKNLKYFDIGVLAGIRKNAFNTRSNSSGVISTYVPYENRYPANRDHVYDGLWGRNKKALKSYDSDFFQSYFHLQLSKKFYLSPSLYFNIGISPGIEVVNVLRTGSEFTENLVTPVFPYDTNTYPNPPSEPILIVEYHSLRYLAYGVLIDGDVVYRVGRFDFSLGYSHSTYIEGNSYRTLFFGVSTRI